MIILKKLLVLLILITLFGCSNSNANSDDNKVESSVEIHGYFKAGTLHTIN